MRFLPTLTLFLNENFQYGDSFDFTLGKVSLSIEALKELSKTLDSSWQFTCEKKTWKKGNGYCSKPNCRFKEWLAKQPLPVDFAVITATNTAYVTTIGAFMGALTNDATSVILVLPLQANLVKPVKILNLNFSDKKGAKL